MKETKLTWWDKYNARIMLGVGVAGLAFAAVGLYFVSVILCIILAIWFFS